MKALLRVDDKKELSDPPRVQEKELKEPERISLRTPKELEFKETELVSVFFRLEFSLRILSLHLQLLLSQKLQLYLVPLHALVDDFVSCIEVQLY